MSEELAQIRMRSGRERSGTVSPVAAVVTIGVFDGVHRGHRCVIEHTVERARAAGLEAAVVTFDPNPLEILRPRQAPARLCSVARRIELIEDLGVDRVLVLPFTADLSHETAEEFIDTTLRCSLEARTIVVGHGFRFGHKAAGTTETLRAAGLEVVEYNLVGDGQAVSSTRIRAAVADGDVAAAAEMLARPHEVEGVVVRGAQRGRGLGYPTANVEHHPLAAVPADGVYAGTTVVDGAVYPSAISVGTNPTFDGQRRTVESYLLDVDMDLYGAEVRVGFIQRLRGMVAFEGVDALVAQMDRDVAYARRLANRP